MIIKILSEKYYGYNGKTKELFKKKYRSVGLKWMSEVNLSGEVVDGWFSSNMKEYLLKLPEDGEFKRFKGNSERMITFLKSCGAEEFNENMVGCHIDYDNSKGFVTQKDRYGCFIGADLINHYRIEELLKDIPDNWNVKWLDKIITMTNSHIEVKEVIIKKINDVKNIHVKKRVIIRRKM